MVVLESQLNCTGQCMAFPPYTVALQCLCRTGAIALDTLYHRVGLARPLSQLILSQPTPYRALRRLYKSHPLQARHGISP